MAGLAMIQYFKHYYRDHPLGMRLLGGILLLSSVITLAATGIQLYGDYRYEHSALDERIRQIETTAIESLSTSLWQISPEQIQVQLDGLRQLPDVEYLAIQTPFNELYQSGQLNERPDMERHYYRLEHLSEGREYHLGDLEVWVNRGNINRRLQQRVLVILFSQGVKTFVVSVFILSLFYRLVTRHLATMASYARKLQLDRLTTPLTLKRHSPARTDELSQVVEAINEMRLSMLADIERRRQAELALAELNSQLELRVEQRTEQLQQANGELRETLDKLTRAQQQLVESEKMAALGSLVAGVAHEISTPLGISFTAASFLEQQSRNQASSQFVDLTLESSEMIRLNLERAAGLLNAFKQVSVDQSSEQSRPFDLVEYLDEILLALKPRLRECNPELVITAPAELPIDSYPGAFYQLFTNLIINSLIHGFTDAQRGRIDISLTSSEASLQIDYRDNGVGLEQGWQQRVFEPFATTKRHLHCSGLGMHICYNLVKQLLQGDISCKTASQGVHFQISVPLKSPQN